MKKPMISNINSIHYGGIILVGFGIVFAIEMHQEFYMYRRKSCRI